MLVAKLSGLAYLAVAGLLYALWRLWRDGSSVDQGDELLSNVREK